MSLLSPSDARNARWLCHRLTASLKMGTKSIFPPDTRKVAQTDHCGFSTQVLLAICEAHLHARAYGLILRSVAVGSAMLQLPIPLPPTSGHVALYFLILSGIAKVDFTFCVLYCCFIHDLARIRTATVSISPLLELGFTLGVCCVRIV